MKKIFVLLLLSLIISVDSYADSISTTVLPEPKGDIEIRKIDGPANIREKPNGKIIGSLENDVYVWVLEKEKDGWSQILYNGLIGWTYKQNLIEISDMKVVRARDYALFIPNDWKLRDSSGSDVAFEAIAPQHEPFTEWIEFIIEGDVRKEGISSSVEYRKFYESYMKAEFSSVYKFIESKDSYFINEEKNGDQIIITMSFFYVTKDGIGYVLNCYSSAEDFKKLKTTFKNIAKSLIFYETNKEE